MLNTQVQYDVIITGAGLAGLGLARQLINGKPSLRVLLIEKARFPRPKAIAKVGESTVEIGSRYLSNELGLSSFLETEQLKKFGIRIFFDAGKNPIEQCDELGASQTFGIPTYQIDRGDIENRLAEDLKNDGVTILDNASINNIKLKKFDQSVRVKVDDTEYLFQSKWLLDASGRANLIKRHKNLQKQSAHRSHAVWFRVDRKITIDTWSRCEKWQARCTPQNRRWLSTNHLVGPGYWVWIIPLPSGATSIGIVMDEQVYRETKWEKFEHTMSWLQNQQTMLAQKLDGAQVLDYVVLADYSYDCKQLFSNEGWAITGEAGLFSDPLYSPGSDFIAISNNFIVSMVLEDFSGKDITLDALIFEKMFRSIYQNTLSLYLDQYGGFGDRQMMGLKLLWDYSYYWGVLSLLFFRKTFTQIDKLRRLNSTLDASQKLNAKVQKAFRERARKRQVLANRGVFMDQYKIPCLQHFNHVLEKPADTEIDEDLMQNVQMLEGIANSVMDMLQDSPELEVSEREYELLGNYRSLILQ